MAIQKHNKPFSMIREFHLADWFTLANASCGTSALFAMMTYLQTAGVRHIYFACALVVAAFVFDVLDGRIARWRQKSSAMGRDLDSLADIVSFGIAPAAIAYGCGMQGFYDRIVLTFFVACGVSRLARFNVTAEALSEGGDKVKYFEGTPIPTSLLLVIMIGLLPHRALCMTRSGSERSYWPASRFIRLYCSSRSLAHLWSAAYGSRNSDLPPCRYFNREETQCATSPRSF
jgi:CDP-diacylglycerol--serine O-phosphatidyltransferase